MLYYNAALRRERRQRAWRFNDVRAAWGADKQEANKLFKTLSK